MSVCGRLDLFGGFLAEGDLDLVREVGGGGVRGRGRFGLGKARAAILREYR